MSEIIKYFQLGYLILKTKLMQIIFYINKQGRLNNCIPPNDYKKKFQCFVYWDETTHNFQITNKFFEIWFAGAINSWLLLDRQKASWKFILQDCQKEFLNLVTNWHYQKRFLKYSLQVWPTLHHSQITK